MIEEFLSAAASVAAHWVRSWSWHNWKSLSLFVAKWRLASASGISQSWLCTRSRSETRRNLCAEFTFHFMALRSIKLLCHTILQFSWERKVSDTQASPRKSQTQCNFPPLELALWPSTRHLPPSPPPPKLYIIAKYQNFYCFEQTTRKSLFPACFSVFEIEKRRKRTLEWWISAAVPSNWNKTSKLLARPFRGERFRPSFDWKLNAVELMFLLLPRQWNI